MTFQLEVAEDEYNYRSVVIALKQTIADIRSQSNVTEKNTFEEVDDKSVSTFMWAVKTAKSCLENPLMAPFVMTIVASLTPTWPQISVLSNHLKRPLNEKGVLTEVFLEDLVKVLSEETRNDLDAMFLYLYEFA